MKPQIVVCLGATAAQALLGRAFRITKSRGQLQRCEFCDGILPTYHPSAVLRAPSSENRARMRAELIHDLKIAARALQSA